MFVVDDAVLLGGHRLLMLTAPVFVRTLGQFSRHVENTRPFKMSFYAQIVQISSSAVVHSLDELQDSLLGSHYNGRHSDEVVERSTTHVVNEQILIDDMLGVNNEKLVKTICSILHP